jgi:hypothetical protein
VIGAYVQTVFTPKEWQFSFNFRGLRSDDHYSGTQFQYQRKALGNFVINTQTLYDFGASYNFTSQFSVFGSLPIVNTSWSIPEPAQPPLGPREEQSASGVGDISAIARWWLMSPSGHPHGNVAAAIGVKAPTGQYAATSVYPDLNGTNRIYKPVDQSIQPGDGGWGVLFDLQGYRSFKHLTFYGSGTYLANPRDTNGTPSIIVGLGFGGNPAFAGLLENSVPDQYLARAGAVFPVMKDRLTLSLGFRMEGLPRYDLFGDSHGFRRPGYETFVEPGIFYTQGRSTWSLFVPKGLVRNRRPNPYTGAAGDATFPDYIILAGYSFRFGGGAPSSNPPLVPPVPDRPAAPAGAALRGNPPDGPAPPAGEGEATVEPVCGSSAPAPSSPGS